MLIKRVITGIIGIICAIFIVNTGGSWFAGAILLLALGAWNEYCRAFKNMDIHAWLSWGGFITAVLIGCAWLGNERETIAVIMTAVIIVLSRNVLQHNKFSFKDAAITITGIMYIALPFSHFLLLRMMADDRMVTTSWGSLSVGCAFLWTALIGTWASDTFAYFIGTALGRHKLCPGISPGKSVEGFIGGIIGTMLSLAGLGVLFGFPLMHMAVLGLGVALTATVGDLVESTVKRLTGIKDSGQLLPGHGGVLDRFDSLLFTVPFVYYYVHVFRFF